MKPPSAATDSGFRYMALCTETRYAITILYHRALNLKYQGF